MGYILFHTFITFLAIVGFIEIIHLLITSFLKNKKTKNFLIIFPTSENIEYELRSYAAKFKWPGSLRPQKIYCVTDNLTQESKDICNIFCKEFDFMEMIETHKTEELIKDIQNF